MDTVYEVIFNYTINTNENGESFSKLYKDRKKAESDILSWWTDRLNKSNLMIEFTEKYEGYWNYNLKDYHSNKRIKTYTNRDIRNVYPACLRERKLID